MQSITRNPIADPSILGVNTGASLFVVVGITFFNLSTASGYIWFALIGAALTSFCVYGIAGNCCSSYFTWQWIKCFSAR